MFGDEIDGWFGKRVTFFPAVYESSESGYAIRVKGSPDIAAPVTFKMKLPKRRPVETKLLKTVVGSQDHADFDTDTGEVFPDPDSEMPVTVEEFTSDPDPTEGFDIGVPGEVVQAELDYKKALKASTLPAAKQTSMVALADANRAKAEMTGDFSGYTDWLAAQTARIPS
jgi:hypothetical protein